MKVALVCDWLTNVGGAEKVLLRLHEMYPEAPIYTSKYDKKGIDWFNDAKVKTGWLQIFPTSLRRFLSPLRQKYFSHLDLSGYDLIISVTGAEAKAVKKGNAKHICYCHVPTQYYWGMYEDYLENPGFGVLNPIVRPFFKLFTKPMRKADYESAQKLDYFITISKHSQQEIKKYYNRESTIIHPPVEIEDFKIKVGKCQIEENNKKGKSQGSNNPQPVENFSANDYYIVTARQVNWKRLDLAVKACLATNQKLLVVGEGPEHEKLVKMAHNSPLIQFLPLQNKSALKDLLTHAKCYLFPSLEPFGIAPVEALAAGCPVIAYQKGGSLDFIKEGENGLLFEKQTVASLAQTITKFEQLKPFDCTKISASVDDFSTARFKQEIKVFIHEKTR